MCGIAGIYRKDRIDDIASDIKKMTAAIAHRGPDGEGNWTDKEKGISFGHRRLSILDLSSDGHQPMHFLGRYVITFNGEIYNYLELKKDLESRGNIFQTKTDTEVLLVAYHQWGEDFLLRLDGMFAFAIYDKLKDELFCARDRFGEKPFFFSNNNIDFSFASEMKSLFSIGKSRSVNQKMLFNYLTYDLVEDPKNKQNTFFKDIHQLPPSHSVRIDSRRNIRIRKYWDLDFKKQIDISENEAKETFQTLFDSSISKRLRSDVNVGSSLSGGVDSSSILGSILTQFPNQEFKTFTARFDDKKYDEGHFIDVLKDAYNFSENYCFPQKNQLLSEIDKIFYHQEEPFGSTSIIAQWEVMKLAKSKNTTVLLDGQGADEMAGGYFKYFYPFLHEIRKDKSRFQKQLSKIEAHLNTSNFISRNQKLRMIAPVLYDTATKATRQFRNTNIGKDLNRDFFKNHYSNESMFHQSHTLNQFLYDEIFSYGLVKLLRFSDRNAMAHGVEVRLPYLSHELVEFVFSLPSNYKINDGWTKNIIRSSMEGRVPREILYRKDKKGFQAPSSWLNDPDVVELTKHSFEQLRSDRILNSMDQSNRWKYIMASKLLSNE
ncbi:MAG: asparagine synthase (glutamine-hydrolyzing) [Crocinitomicaceae bacterium]|nr:asparagine synthase (glutamine-hydrolyzing) [Crocinitomicaceae bacterium]